MLFHILDIFGSRHALNILTRSCTKFVDVLHIARHKHQSIRIGTSHLIMIAF